MRHGELCPVLCGDLSGRAKNEGPCVHTAGACCVQQQLIQYGKATIRGEKLNNKRARFKLKTYKTNCTIIFLFLSFYIPCLLFLTLFPVHFYLAISSCLLDFLSKPLFLKKKNLNVFASL